MVVGGLVAALAWPVPARAGAEPAGLARCDVLESSRRVRDSARVVADHLTDGYSGTHPAAAVLAGSMAEIAATLDSQLRALEPTHQAFQEAWAAFDQAVRRSPLPRDPALRPVLPSYRHNAEELERLLGCESPASQPEMIPCPAIPTAHLVAVVGGRIHEYLDDRYADSYPEHVTAAGELARAARDLHHALHDLEIAVPGALGSFRTLAAALEGSALTDTDEPEDLEVKSRLAALARAVEGLEGLVGSCHAAPEGHDEH